MSFTPLRFVVVEDFKEIFSGDCEGVEPTSQEMGPGRQVT